MRETFRLPLTRHPAVRLLVLATLAHLCACGGPVDDAVSPVEAVGVAEALCAQLDAAPMQADQRAFFAGTQQTVRQGADLVRLADSVGQGGQYRVRRLAGYTVWLTLTEASTLAHRGVKVDASAAADVCVRMGVLECDLDGWEHAYAPPPPEYRTAP